MMNSVTLELVWVEFSSAFQYNQRPLYLFDGITPRPCGHGSSICDREIVGNNCEVKS